MDDHLSKTKRQRQGSTWSRGKMRRIRKAPGRRGAKRTRSNRHVQKKIAAQTPAYARKLKPRDGKSQQAVVSHNVTHTVSPDERGGSRHGNGRVRRIRTSFPAAQPDSRGATQRSGIGRGTRTPLPALIPGELEEVNLRAAQARQSRGARTFEDKARRLQHIQDFSHNPALFDLRVKELGTSSTPEEIEARTGEVQYQVQVLRSLMSVLTEELKTLEQARRSLSRAQS